MIKIEQFEREKQRENNSLRETIIKVCFAKFMAEQAPGVGRSTFLYLKKGDSPMYGIALDVVKEVRKSWKKGGCPKIPSGIIKKLNQFPVVFFGGLGGPGGPGGAGENL